MRVRIAATSAALMAALLGNSPAAGAPADSLSAHEKKAIAILLYSRICADCPAAPNMKTARWRFSSDLSLKGGIGIAYALVSYRTFARRPQAVLLGFDPYVGKWKLLESSPDGTNRFLCGQRLLLHPDVGIDRQLRVARAVIRCVG